MALAEIVAYKKSLIPRQKAVVEGFKNQLVPTKKSLIAALSKEKNAFICEIKPASPSKGIIAKEVDVAHIAQHYAAFADALSVLADEKYFGGSYANVKIASCAQPHPVLCKDVVVSPLQIYEARYFGADAVLLMLSVLNDEEYKQCAHVAKSFNMDFITEVHTEEEMLRAKHLCAPIIGINNRNLKTLTIDMGTSERLALLAPKNAFLISESGFYNHKQIKQLAEQVDGFLIGTTLMQAARIDLALRELIFGRVKICGLTNHDDALAAYKSGAYYGGLNFSPLSKRLVSVEEASVIKKDVPLLWGGVFVNQPLQHVVEIKERLGLEFVQLHGDENHAYISDLKTELKDCEIWKAIRVGHHLTIPLLPVSRFILDSFDPSAYGGTGNPFDWSLLKDIALHDHVIAGGINPDNVVKISHFYPFALDVASGIEDKNPRQKSLSKMNNLFYELRP